MHFYTEIMKTHVAENVTEPRVEAKTKKKAKKNNQGELLHRNEGLLQKLIGKRDGLS